MISSFRNFAKTKFAGLLVFIMIIPFVFWGMGSMFSSGNTNTIAQINKKKISTQEFIDYINGSRIPEKTIRENLENNIIEELLSGLISATLMDLEVKNFDLMISKNTLSKKIRQNKNFFDENGNFQRIKYEKFLLENNQSAPQFEQRLKMREEQKNLFDYINAGIKSPKFLTTKLFEEENKKLEIDYINLENYYKKKNEFSEEELNNFLNENKEQLNIEYIDFKYVIINPKNLVGVDEYNQAFFDKIDDIEIDISNEVSFEEIVSKLDLNPIQKKDFKFSSNENYIEQKIFESRNNNFDIFENDDEFILYRIQNIEKRKPDLNDKQIKDEILNLLSQKSKFDYNKEILEKIRENKFDNNAFLKMGKNDIQNTILNSIKDNNKFEINSVKALYALPLESFTLINDDQNNIYLVKLKKFYNKRELDNSELLDEYKTKQKSIMKTNILKTYDMYLNNRYNIVLNQKTIERVKNYFQ